MSKHSTQRPPRTLKGSSSADDGGEMLRVVGAAILDATARRCLVAQRGATQSNPLQWEFPGGKVQVRETPQDALQREIQEELAIEIQVEGLLGRSLLATAGRRIELRVFVCRWLSGEIHLAEHREWRWVGPDELAILDWSVADLPLIPKLRKHLQRSDAGPEQTVPPSFDN